MKKKTEMRQTLRSTVLIGVWSTLRSLRLQKLANLLTRYFVIFETQTNTKGLSDEQVGQILWEEIRADYYSAPCDMVNQNNLLKCLPECMDFAYSRKEKPAAILAVSLCYRSDWVEARQFSNLDDFKERGSEVYGNKERLDLVFFVRAKRNKLVYWAVKTNFEDLPKENPDYPLAPLR